MTHHQPVTYRLLRGCPDDDICPAITDTGEPDALYFIGDPTGPDQFRLPADFAPELPAEHGWAHLAGTEITAGPTLDAHAHRMARHERLYRVPLADIPDALRKAVTPE